MPENPFRPERTPLHPRDALIRAVMASALTHIDPARRSMRDIVAQRYGSDPAVLAILERSAATPATSTVSGWASQFSATAVADFITHTPSASAALFARALNINPGSAGKVSLPVRATAPGTTGATWVAEASPAPVRQGSFTAVDLGPLHKLIALAVMTEELMAASNAEAVLRAMLGEDLGLALDACLFGNAAGDTTKPAGLLAGVTPTTKSALTDPGAAMLDDFDALTAAITGSGATDVLFVANTEQALSARRRLLPGAATVLASPALAAGTVVGLDPDSLAVSVDPMIQIETSREAVLHMEDTSPAALSTGTTPTVATPIRSMFQTGTVAIRLMLRVTWAMRASGAVAVTTGVGWGS